MNNILLDSHIFLWAITDSSELSKAAKRLIESTRTIYVSSLSFFELNAKQAKGKIRLPDNLLDLTDQQNFTIIDLTPKQLESYRIFHTSNADPVDNGLLAIAENKHFGFLTADLKIIPLSKSYPWIINGR